MKVYLDRHYVKVLVVTVIFSVIEETILGTTAISVKLIKNHIYWRLLHLCHVCVDPLELLAYLCGYIITLIVLLEQQITLITKRQIDHDYVDNQELQQLVPSVPIYPHIDPFLNHDSLI